MKRIYCLYRVSTTHQVEYSDDDNGDIPMQKTACHEFAESQPGWTILKEFYEKGISGYKASADNRDAIQDLKKAAEKLFVAFLSLIIRSCLLRKLHSILSDNGYPLKKVLMELDKQKQIQLSADFSPTTLIPPTKLQQTISNLISADFV